MFGLGSKQDDSEPLSVQVHAVVGDEVLKLATKIWDENIRTVHLDPGTHKEFLRFGYENPKCVVWLQHDQNRVDTLELIVRWEADKRHEVFVITGGRQPAGEQERAKAVLNGMLTTAAVVLSSDKY